MLMIAQWHDAHLSRVFVEVKDWTDQSGKIAVRRVGMIYDMNLPDEIPAEEQSNAKFLNVHIKIVGGASRRVYLDVVRGNISELQASLFDAKTNFAGTS